MYSFPAFFIVERTNTMHKIIRLQEVIKSTELARSTIYEKIGKNAPLHKSVSAPTLLDGLR